MTTTISNEYNIKGADVFKVGEATDLSVHITAVMGHILGYCIKASGEPLSGLEAYHYFLYDGKTPLIQDGFDVHVKSFYGNDISLAVTRIVA